MKVVTKQPLKKYASCCLNPNEESDSSEQYSTTSQGNESNQKFQINISTEQIDRKNANWTWKNLLNNLVSSSAALSKVEKKNEDKVKLPSIGNAFQAISVMFKTEQQSVKLHSALKLFNLPNEEVDFYLPQIIVMYVEMDKDIRRALRPYILHRCNQSIDFMLNCSCFLKTYMNPNSNISVKVQKRAHKLYSRILIKSTTDLQGFDSKDKLDLLNQEMQFIQELMDIGKKLVPKPTKKTRVERFPSRLWLPICSSHHHIVHIPPYSSVVLNSKDKVPYIIYVEVLECCNKTLDILPQRRIRCISTRSTQPTDECQTQSDDEVNEHLTNLSINNHKICQSESNLNESQSFNIRAVDIRRRLSDHCENRNRTNFKSDMSNPEGAMNELWVDKERRIRQASPYGHLPNWKLKSVIVKSGDDLRQDLLAYQMLTNLQNIWLKEQVPLWVRPYRIMVISEDSGMIEPILDGVSLHQVKKTSGLSLLNYFHAKFGPDNSEEFLQARMNFLQSLAAYSIICYLFQIKDRHNGNILLDNEGHIIHIDFGFILSSAPKLGVETSPFKLTEEFIEVLGGPNSNLVDYYVLLILKGLLVARKHMDKILLLVEIMSMGGTLSCMNGKSTINELTERFHLKQTDEQLHELVDTMVEGALRSWTTRLYDIFQYMFNNIVY